MSEEEKPILLKVHIKGNDILKKSLKEVTDRNSTEPDTKSYEDIFKTVVTDGKLLDQIKKYVGTKWKDPNAKNDRRAMLHKNEAVNYYNTGNFKDALDSYNDCLAFASFCAEEMATTYCHRSAVYFVLGLYEFCLEDLIRAKCIGYPCKTKYVLDYNFSCCYYKLKNFRTASQCASDGIEVLNQLCEYNSTASYKYIRERFEVLKSKADNLFQEEAGQEIVDKMMNLNIARNVAESKNLKLEENALENATNRNINTQENENVGIDFSCILENSKSHVQGMVRTNFKQNDCRSFLEFLNDEDSNDSSGQSAIALNSASYDRFCRERSDLLRKFSKDFEIGYNKETGFRLKATKELNPGTIITTDQPFVSRLRVGTKRYYCPCCFQRADLLMIPCRHCSEVRFCSEKCRTIAWEKFHYVECGYVRFLLKTDPIGYLCLRILLKVGVNKLAGLSPSEPKKIENDNPNLTDPGIYYRYFYNLPLTNSSASNKTEAAIGAVVILYFLERMYSRISEVENGSLKVEDVISTSTFDKTTFSQNEIHGFGLRIMKHWLQLSENFLKLSHRRVYVTPLKNEVNDVNYEHAAVWVFPLLDLFNHSCDPNVDVFRFEGGPVIFRVAQKIEPGEVLTFAKGTDIYTQEYDVRKKKLDMDCSCKACSMELMMKVSQGTKVQKVSAELKEAENFFIQGQFDMLLEPSLRLVNQDKILEKQGAWLFWKLLRYIFLGINTHYGKYKSEKDSRPEPKNTATIVKAALKSLENLDISQLSLYAFPNYAIIAVNFIWILHQLSIFEPLIFEMHKVKKALSDYLKLLLKFKDVYRSYSKSTHFDICVLSLLDSGERSLNALMIRK